MSIIVDQELEATGVASVIIVLRSQAGAATSSATVRDLAKYCIQSELTQESAILTDAQARAEVAGKRTATRGSAQARKRAEELLPRPPT
jgi:hypothetical protein